MTTYGEQWLKDQEVKHWTELAHATPMPDGRAVADMMWSSLAGAWFFDTTHTLWLLAVKDGVPFWSVPTDTSFWDQAKGTLTDTFKAIAPYVATIASFVPGVGTGVSAALQAGVALADGRSLSDAIVAGVKGSLPGGPLAAAAFDGALALAKGESLSAAALAAARDALPGGDLAKKAFDVAVAVAHGKKLQDAAFDAAAASMPGGATSAAAIDFARRVKAGENVADAALATGGAAALAAARRYIPEAPPELKSLFKKGSAPGGSSTSTSKPSSPLGVKPSGKPLPARPTVSDAFGSADASAGDDTLTKLALLLLLGGVA